MSNTIFEEIRKDHVTQRELLDKITRTTGDSDVREMLWKKLKTELEVHADVEERFFYRKLMNHDISQDQARHSIAEHHEIDELIEKLEETEMSSPAWLTYAKQLKEMVEHHLDEEEHEIFQVAGKALSENQKTGLAKEYRASMEDRK